MSAPNSAALSDLAAISGAFPLPVGLVAGRPRGTGHINETFALVFDKAGAPVRYFFQRINDRIFIGVSPTCQLSPRAPKPRVPGYPEATKSLGEYIRNRRMDLGLLQRDLPAAIAARFDR
jgi:hypothetical protein